MPNRPFSFSFAVLLLGANACTALERASDCGGVIDIVNDGLDVVRFDAPDAGDTETYERFAATYDDVSKQISALAIEDAALAKAVGTYREIMDRAAKNSRAYAGELGNRSTK